MTYKGLTMSAYMESPLAFMWIVFPLGATFMVVLFGVLHWMTGNKLVVGQGRVLQTVLAVLNFSNVPLGTAYAVYALWVCWMNETTKRVMDDPVNNLGDLNMF